VLQMLLNVVVVERMITYEAKPSALSFLKTTTVFIVYEHKWCFNWLVAWSTGQDRSKLTR